MRVLCLDHTNTKHDENSDFIKTPLKPHQKTLLAAACNLEQGGFSVPQESECKKITTTIGVLCDKVGSGKSLVISSIIAESPYLKTSLPHEITFGGTISLSYTLKENPYAPINIILVPHTIIKQWSGYISKQTSFKFFIVNNAKTFELFCKNANSMIDEYDIMLISNTKYKKVLALWEESINKKCSRFIIDEADSIKITNFYPIDSHFTWLVTSSWQCLQNPYGSMRFANTEGQLSIHYNYDTGFVYRTYINPIQNTGFIKRLFTDLRKREFSGIVNNCIYLKNKDDYVDQSFALELPDIIKIICENPIAISILHNLVDPEIIKLLNAGNMQGAIEKMKCVKTGREHLLSLVTQDITNDIQNKQIEFDAKSKMVYASQKQKEESLQKIMVAIKELESKKKMLVSRIFDSNMCSICFDESDNTTLLNCCHSKYCFACISTWLTSKPSCPNCRSNVKKDNMIIISDKHDGGGGGGEAEKKKRKDKLDNLFDILLKRKKEGNMKCLIFSEYFTNYYSKLEDFLTDTGISFSYLKGSGASINSKLHAYRNGSLDCLLMNARHCGSGINLENTTDIIIYHSMSNELTQQVIGRAQRPGRTTKLKVWKLLYENEA